MTDQNATQENTNSETKATIENLDSVFEGDDINIETAKENSKKDESGAAENKDDKTKDDKNQADDDADEGDEEGKKKSETSSDEEKKSVPYKALKDERQKRQKAEEENAMLRAKLSPPEEDEDAPDPVEDPEGYEKHVEAKVQKKIIKEKISNSRKRMVESEEFGQDYEKMEQTFLFLANQNPDLVREMNEHSDPAKFVFEKGKEYHDNIRAEIRAEIEAEDGNSADDKGKKPSKEADKKSGTQVPNLNKAAAAGSNSDKSEKAQTLDDVMKGSSF